jgi:epsilon-lactone hydrolase
VRHVGSKKVALLVLLTVTLGLARESGSSARADVPLVDQDGTIHLPAFLLPESSLLDDSARNALKRSREQMKSEEAAAIACPSMDPAAREHAAAIRRCEAERFHHSRVYKQFLERYPVTVAVQTIGGIDTEVFTPKLGIAPRNKGRVLINLHGGHFKSGSRTISHLESIPIAAVGKIKVISVDYRMAPEYAFPAASEDVAAVYRELLKSYQPKNIGVYGCSAGSLLTAESMAWFQKEGLPPPAAIGMFGGGASYYQEGDSGQLAAAMSDRPLEPPTVHPYFRVTDPRSPLAFPIYSARILARFPPSLLIAGTRDVGESAAIYTHEQLIKQGVEARLHIWEGMQHCFFNALDLPQTDEVNEVIVRFFEQHLGQ